MFTCGRCGVNSADGFIMPGGTWLCTSCAMPTDNVDQNSLSALAQAKTVQEKIDAWRNCNGIQQSPKSHDSAEKTMAEKTASGEDGVVGDDPAARKQWRGQTKAAQKARASSAWSCSNPAHGGRAMSNALTCSTASPALASSPPRSQMRTLRERLRGSPQTMA